MNWSLFILVIIAGEGLILLQAFAAFRDGLFSDNQDEWSRWHGQAYTFLQHGGMWADFFIITPLVAYLVGEYQFYYLSSLGLSILVVSLVLWTILAVYIYAPMGKQSPEAHAHDGNITIAGWIYVLYATFASWIIAMMYIHNMAEPYLLNKDIIITSVALVPWIIAGVMKFTPQWKFNSASITQVYVGILGIIFLTLVSLQTCS